MGFSWQEYWSGCPFPSPGDLSDPGLNPHRLQIHLGLGSVQLSHSVVSDSLRPHESQHARPPCPSPTPGVHSNSRPLSRWCHPAISSSVVPFSSCPQSLPASESFPMSQLFASGGQSTRVAALASFLPKKSLSFIFLFYWVNSTVNEDILNNDKNILKPILQNSPEVQWLASSTFTAGLGSISGWGTKTL